MAECDLVQKEKGERKERERERERGIERERKTGEKDGRKRE